MSLAALAVREVEARHAAFAAWFAQGDEAAMEATARAFAPGMERVGPDGAAQDREAVLAMLRRARGSGAVEIAVEDARALWAHGDAALVAYVERQTRRGREATARRATALLVRDEGAPGGVAWRFVQETWIGTDRVGEDA